MILPSLKHVLEPLLEAEDVCYLAGTRTNFIALMGMYASHGLKCFDLEVMDSGDEMYRRIITGGGQYLYTDDFISSVFLKDGLSEKIIEIDKSIYTRMFIVNLDRFCQSELGSDKTSINMLIYSAIRLANNASPSTLERLKPALNFVKLIFSGNQKILSGNHLTASDIKAVDAIYQKAIAPYSGIGKYEALWTKIKIAFGLDSFHSKTITALAFNPVVGLSILRSCACGEPFWPISEQAKCELAFSCLQRMQTILSRSTMFEFEDGHFWIGGAPQINLIPIGNMDVLNPEVQQKELNSFLESRDAFSDVQPVTSPGCCNFWAAELAKTICTMARQNSSFLAGISDIARQKEGGYIMPLLDSINNRLSLSHCRPVKSPVKC